MRNVLYKLALLFSIITVSTTATSQPVNPYVLTAAKIAAALGYTPGPAITPPTVIYAMGSSIERGLGLGGTTRTGGGLPNNYVAQLAASEWGARATYYNNGVDGYTTTQMLAGYTIGNTCCDGVVVPSAQSVKPSGTGGYLFISTSSVYNDSIASGPTIPYATSLSNLQALVTAAKADGWFVIMMTCPVVGTTSAGTTQIQNINRDIRDGLIPADMVLDMATWLPKQTNTFDYIVSGGVHPTLYGHTVLARNLKRAMMSGGDTINYAGLGYESRNMSYGQAVTFENSITVTGLVTAQAGMALSVSSGATPPLAIIANTISTEIFTMANAPTNGFNDFSLIGNTITYNFGAGNSAAGAGFAGKWFVWNKTSGGVPAFAVDNTSLTLRGGIITGAPASGTAAIWKLGLLVTSTTCVLDATAYVQIDISGVARKVALCQ